MTAIPGAALKRVTLSGYYGCGNAGDEAVLAGIRDAFRFRAGDGVVLTALSQRPEETKASQCVSAANRMDMKALIRTIRNCDLLISGGGSLLQDTTSLKSLLYYLFVMQIASTYKVPFMFYAQGIGPLQRGLSKKLVRMTANKAAYITVRDEESAQLLKAVGVSKTKIEVTEDPAFALNPAADSAVDTALSQNSIQPNRDYVGIALRPWGDGSPQQIDKYRSMLKLIVQYTGCTPLLLPMHHPDDLELARLIDPQGAYPLLSKSYSPEVVLGVVSRLSAVVAMRLHTLIFAARTAVPLYALAYDPKVSNLMKRLQLNESVVDVNAFSPEAVIAQIVSMLKRRESVVSQLKLTAGNREEAALRNCDIALQILRK